MKAQKRRSALKIAGLVLLAAAVLFSLVSLAAVQVLFSDTFRRTAPREYTASLRYSDVADQYGREAVSFLSGKNRLRGHLYGGGNPAGLVVISHGLGAARRAICPRPCTLWTTAIRSCATATQAAGTARGKTAWA